MEGYLERFGHFVESADPLHPTLRESPEIATQYLTVARQSETSPDERLAHARAGRVEAERQVHALHGARGYLARCCLVRGKATPPMLTTPYSTSSVSRLRAALRLAGVWQVRGYWSEQKTCSIWNGESCRRHNLAWHNW